MSHLSDWIMLSKLRESVSKVNLPIGNIQSAIYVAIQLRLNLLAAKHGLLKISFKGTRYLEQSQ